MALWGWLLAFSVSAQVRLEVIQHVPLRLADAPLYLASTLNNWNPGDPNYRFSRDSAGVHFLNLPKTPDHFAYKITQGNWTFVEGDARGNSLPDRVYDRQKTPNPDRVPIRIAGWEKRIRYEFIIRRIPENTPYDAGLYITGNFNNWNPGDPAYKLTRSIDGTLRVAIYAEQDRVEFKFTRGNWASIEGRKTGKARPNRVLFRNSDVDTKGISIEIDSWEDLAGTFSFFSLYDLLMLFSAFQGVLLIIAIPTIQNANRLANRWLSASIALVSAMVLLQVVGSYRDVAQTFTKLLLLPDFVIFLYAPLFYFYLQRLLFNTKTVSSRWTYHFAPSIALLFAYLPFLLMDSRLFQNKIIAQDWALWTVFLTVGVLGWGWNLYYWGLYQRAIHFYREQYKTHYSYEQNLQYLSTVLFIQAACLSLWFFMFLMLGAGWVFGFDSIPIVERIIDGIWLVFSLITYFVGYFAIHQPETFKVAPQTFSIFDDVLDSPLQPVLVTPAKEHSPDPETLSPLKEKVDSYVLKHKLYTNPQLSLNELATKLKMPPHTLSRVINDGFGVNFFDFINTYRIEEFKRRAEDPHYKQYTLLGIAYEVGFNSKSAFNRSFKKITGNTPREYFNLTHEPAE
ncbi:MAG: helix-turn-helix domain-containing protein [Spirosoma sp.]|nr:helix-turn-helix domain-containing protein [Spirosoma sp.]